MAEPRRRRPVALNKKTPPQAGRGSHPALGGLIIKKQKNTEALSLLDAARSP